MRVVVLGLGISGDAAARYLRERGDEVIGVDRNVSSKDFPFFFESGPIVLQNVDLVVKSPGIPFTHPWVEAARASSIPILGEIDLALRELKKRDKTVYGITGSNGKTTTTLMAAHFLNTYGKKTVAAGNIGSPLIDQIRSDADVYVVEFSSFQLEQVLKNPVLDGAAILNLTPNHLDRYPTFQDYVEAKLCIARLLKKDAPFYVSKQAATFCRFKHEIFDSLQEKVETICSLSYRDSFYPHDLQNASAAYALTRIPEEFLIKGLVTFVRPPHRLEFVRTFAGVTYINDSKATSVDAVIKAVQAIKAPILLIAGGVDKGGAFSDWLPHFKEKVLRVFALGAAARRIEQELIPEIKVEKVSSLEEGVQMASNMAVAGATVLLSPGCSSYDQFKDYQHRGEAFRQIVKEKL
jgi:UDP-N-acetylmuramoylalanine--D-glutamate ligase